LASLNEITSTEKLLDLIRKKTGAPLVKTASLEESSPVLPSPQKKSKQIRFRKVSKVSVHKPVTVGVDIGHEYLRLLKTVKSNDGMPAIIDQRRILIPANFPRGSMEFANYLKEQLTSFCGVNKKLQLWALMSAARVEVRHIRIPKVPKKQLESVILWTIKKESPLNENENILDFDVLGEVMEQGIAKWSIMYYTAPKQEIEDTKKLFSRAGWPLTGLSIAPFAVQNIFRTRWLADSDSTVASLFIGNDYSRIDVYTRGSLVMTRGIKAGISSMTESLLEGYNEKTALTRGGKDRLPMDARKAREILFSLSPEAPLLTDDNRLGLQESEIWEMVLPAVERLVRQVERTFEYFTVNLGNEKVDKIYVSGAMNVYHSMVEYVGAQLGMASERFDPLSSQQISPYEGGDMLASLAERAAFAVVLGMALSDNKYTPNFIFTYKDKGREASVKRINMLIFTVFMSSVAICAGVFIYQQHAIAQKQNLVLQLNNQISQFNPPVDREVIMKSVVAVKQDITSAKIYGQRYQCLAIISELANLVAPEIRLIKIGAKLGSSAEKSKETGQDKTAAVQAKKTEEMKEVEIEGFVTGDKKTFDTTLGNYALMLDNSPLFKDIKIQKTGVENFRKTTLLRFTINMKVEGI